jgi:UMF1 family MFS transporter
LRGTRPSTITDPAATAGSTFRTVASTLRHWRAHREALRVLLSFFLISDVLVTMQFFVAIVLASSFGVAVEGILQLQLMGTLIAVPATLFCGMLADRWGARRTIAVLCGGLALGVLLLAFGPASWAPTAAFAMLGLAYGSVQAVYRALYASLIPGESASQLFGFNAIAGRLSAALGPLIFGAVAAACGNTVALCVLLIPLALGVGLLSRTGTRPSNVNATGDFRA